MMVQLSALIITAFRKKRLGRMILGRCICADGRLPAFMPQFGQHIEHGVNTDTRYLMTRLNYRVQAVLKLVLRSLIKSEFLKSK
jgi:hypothetical protein